MRTVLLFGHTSGLGYEVSKKFLDAGYAVVGVARRESDLSSDKLTNLKADLARKDEIMLVTNKIKQQHSSFDALIFCA